MKIRFKKLVAMMLSVVMLLSINPTILAEDGEVEDTINTSIMSQTNSNIVDESFDETVDESLNGENATFSLTSTRVGLWREITLFIEDGSISLFGHANKTIDYEQGETSGTADAIIITNRDSSISSDNRVWVDADKGNVDLTIRDLNIDGGYIGIGYGDVSIELDGDNKITASSKEAGITVTIGGSHLIINDDDENGVLYVTGGYDASGIGSFGGDFYGYAPAHGDITINGGTIVATAGDGGAAGIGSAYKGTTYAHEIPTITINGGDVTATGAVGIGGTRSSTAGNIVINGGVVTTEGYDGAGIGGGSFTDVGNISIAGGFVTSISKNTAAIGGDDVGGNINIVGGTVCVIGGNSNYVANYGQKVPDIGADASDLLTNAAGAVDVTTLVEGATVASTREIDGVVYHIHTYDALVNDSAATCINQRHISFLCLDPECPDKLVTDYAVGLPLGHDFVRDPGRDVIATPEQDGVEAYTCSRCPETDDKSITYVAPMVNELAAPVPTLSQMTVNRGEAVTISWYVSEGAERYGVWFYDSNPGTYVDAGSSLSVTHVFEHNNPKDAPFAVQIYALAGTGENQKQSEPATVLVTVGCDEGKHDFTGATVYDRTLYREIPGDHEFHLAYADVYKQTCIECGMSGFETTFERDAAQQEQQKHSYVDGICQVEGCKHVCVHQYADKQENGNKVPVTNSGVWESQGKEGHVCTSIEYVTQCQYCLMESTRVEAYPYGNEVQAHLIHTEVLTYDYDLNEHWPVKVRETCGAHGCNYSSVKEVSGKHEPHQMENGSCTLCGSGIQSGTFKYGGFINPEADSTATYYYSDSYFNDDATGEANPHLATMSLCLELSAWTSFDTGETWNAEEKTQNARQLLDDIGFDEFEYNDGWLTPPEMNSIGAVAAYKNIGDTTVIALAVRGGGYYSEWGGNFVVGSSGNHDGFDQTSDQVIHFLQEYVLRHMESFNPTVKLWVVGFSRGGATANMTAGKIIEKPSLLFNMFTPENIFAYTFEAPMGYVGDNTGYPSIKNYVLTYDLVPLVAPEDWGFGRYNDHDELPLEGSLSTKNYNTLRFYRQYDIVKAGVPYSSKNQDGAYRIEPYAYYLSYDISHWRWYLNSTGGLVSDVIESVEFRKSDITTDEMLSSTVRSLFSNIPGLRGGYARDIEKAATELISTLMDYNADFDLNKVVNNAFLANDYKGLKAVIGTFLAPDWIMPAGRLEQTAALAATMFCDELSKQTGKKVPDDVSSAAAAVATALFESFKDSPDDLVALGYYLFSTGFQFHWPEVSLAWMMSKDSYYTQNSVETEYPEAYRTVMINCPVDVVVYDANGYEFASIRGETVKNTSDVHGAFVTDTGTKKVILPSDEAYSIKIIATGNGEMDYTVLEYNVRDREYNMLQSYQDLPLETGDSYWGTIPAFQLADYYDTESDGSTTEYLLQAPNGRVLQPETVLRGDEVYYATVTLSTNNGKGIVTGGGSFVTTSYAQVEAICIPTVEFLGWYRDGQLVSNDPIYRFEVKEDMALVAHFSEGDFYTLTVVGTDGGIVPEGRYEVPATVQIQLSAEAAEGFSFVRWEATAGTFSNSQSLETLFTMPAAEVTITAMFDLTNTVLPPDTGDHAPVELYWLLFGASACAMLICLIMLKRRTRKMV